MSCIFFTRDFGYLFKSSLRAMVSKCFANFCHLPSQVLSRICLGSISLFALVGCVLCFCNPAICSVSIVQLPMSDFHCICTIPNLPPNRGRPIHIGVESLLDHSELLLYLVVPFDVINASSAAHPAGWSNIRAAPCNGSLPAQIIIF